MKILIGAKGKHLKTNKEVTVDLEIKLVDRVQVLTTLGGNQYYVDAIIESWKYPWNLKGLHTNEISVPFSELLDALYAFRISHNLTELPWYRKVEKLLEDLEA